MINVFLIINKIIKKILNNKNFLNFSIILTLFFITFITTNINNPFVQTLIFLTKLSSIRVLILFFILFISYYNFNLGLLYLISITILMNIPSHIENFSSIPNLVDKKKIAKINKNFKNPVKITEDKKLKKPQKELEINDTDEDTKKDIKKRKSKKPQAISQDYNEELKKKVAEINLDEKEDTIEKELKKKYTNDYKKLEEFESSSSGSSSSESSGSSTDSSDSEKELDEVSMDVARSHMLNKLRTGLKKKYLND